METIDIKQWCEEFCKGKTKSESLSADCLQIFFNLCFNENKFETDKELQEKMNTQFIMQVINKRLSLYSYTMTYSAKLALAMIFSSSLGNNTMNMTYLQFLSSESGVKKINMEFLSSKAFPFGTFKKEFYDEMWDKQKVERKPLPLGSDNLLDYPEEINKLKY